MPITQENTHEEEHIPTRTYTEGDMILFLSWIRNSHYIPDGMKGWGREDFSPFFEVKPATIIQDFNEFLDQQANQKSHTPSKPR